jgi:hypothetical protein
MMNQDFRAPQGPLPRHGSKPAVAGPPSGSHQPTPARRLGRDPRSHRLVARLNQERARGVNEGRRIWHQPSSVTGFHPQSPALRIGHLPGPPQSTTTTGPKAPYSAAS